MPRVWVGASHVLGRPVLVTETYPHICMASVTGLMTGVQFKIWRRDCAACQAEAAARRSTSEVSDG